MLSQTQICMGLVVSYIRVPVARAAAGQAMASVDAALLSLLTLEWLQGIPSGVSTCHLHFPASPYQLSRVFAADKA